MCNAWCLDFARSLLPFIGSEERILEVGSRDVNGTAKELLAGYAREYVGIDIIEGPSVDKVLDVNDLADSFAPGSFDVVVSTEMLEHCLDWRGALFQMTAVLRVGGMLLITTRSPGFELHDYPADHWRFTISDFKEIFSPIGEILVLESDMTLGWACGIGVILRKTAQIPALGIWRSDLDKVTVYSMAEETGISQSKGNMAGEIIFDQYSRYRACSEIIESVSSGGTILDVGSGPQCLLERFLPDRAIFFADPLIPALHKEDNTRVTGDVFDSKLDGRKFDYVCSVDTLEHIPANARDDFVLRMSNLADKGLILGFPCSDDVTAFQVDSAVDETYRRAYGKGYSWLGEHFRYTLPNRGDTVSLLQRLGWKVSIVGHGHAPWLSSLLGEVICGWEISDAHPHILRISRRFNLELFRYDFSPPFYRWFVIALKEPLPDARLQFGVLIDEFATKRFAEILADTRVGLFSSFLDATTARDAAITERNEAAAERDAAMIERDEARAYAYAMRNSNSWRVTYPLRAIAKKIRSGQH
jgi:O-antigen biosynthesis protein